MHNLKSMVAGSMRKTIGWSVFLAGVIAAPAVAQGDYPSMAPIERYRSASVAAEVALARSAAPPSISDKATVLVLGARGYETAAEGTNGFVCVVQRSWGNDLDSPDFWNSKVRAPICFNGPAARSVLPAYLERTEWVLAGVRREEIAERVQARFGALTPEIGAMCYMMSKDGYLGDDDSGPWRPHLMYFLPKTDPESWGANLEGAPILGGVVAPRSEPISVFLTPVPRWSDGSADQPFAGERDHRHDGGD